MGRPGSEVVLGAFPASFCSKKQPESNGKRCVADTLRRPVFRSLAGAQNRSCRRGDWFWPLACASCFRCFLSPVGTFSRLFCRGAHSDPKVGPKGVQNEPKLGPSWAVFGPSWVQAGCPAVWRQVSWQAVCIVAPEPSATQPQPNSSQPRKVSSLSSIVVDLLDYISCYFETLILSYF